MLAARGSQPRDNDSNNCELNLPIFYITEFTPSQTQITLDEETSRHIVQVLRMKKGDRIHLTEGKGHLLTCTISDDHKKHCTVIVDTATYNEQPVRNTSIGISLLKNTSRFEWFLEKATELGTSSIIPLLCERTEKERFRHDRMQQICISAMLQSQQYWMPLLHQPIAFELLFRQEEIVNTSQKFIAHCEKGADKKHLSFYSPFENSTLVIIGPEGDFTPDEIKLALDNSFIPVSLGETRLRTETAGITAAVLLQR
ncbi:MAG TPA: RsmE family RNA methyltransferase [Chitinophagaceae bacterium]